jgi:hypothetical protein
MWIKCRLGHRNARRRIKSSASAFFAWAVAVGASKKQLVRSSSSSRSSEQQQSPTKNTQKLHNFDLFIKKTKLCNLASEKQGAFQSVCIFYYTILLFAFLGLSAFLSGVRNNFLQSEILCNFFYTRFPAKILEI